MSVRIMSSIFRANFDKIIVNISKVKDYDRTVKASTAKFILIALADCANDEGRSAYPSTKSLAMKTNISTRAVMYALKALEDVGIIHREGTSKYGTIDYSINIKAIENLEWDLEATRSYDDPHIRVEGYASDTPMQVIHVTSASDTENSVSLADNTSLKPSINTRAKFSKEEHKSQTLKSLEIFYQKQKEGQADFAWLDEGLVGLARAFVGAVGDQYIPTKSERSHWRKVLLEWQQIGITDDIITATVQKMKTQGLNIVGVQSITGMARSTMSISDLPPVFHADLGGLTEQEWYAKNYHK